MSGIKILILCGAIAFLIGALAPAFYPGGGPKSIGWLCLGFSFLSFAYFLQQH
jgi:hypothetical protein